MGLDTSQAQLSTTKQLFSRGGGSRWATERLLAAIKAGRRMSPAELRTCDTLSKDQWKFFDNQLVEEAKIRLKGVADLIANGLTTNIPNAMGRTMIEWEKVSDMEPAIVSMDGRGRSDDDRQEFDLDGIPLPITHKDFNITLRALEASRNGGVFTVEPLNTSQIRVSGRLVSEMLEYMLFRGGPTFGGRVIYGYTNHPNRNTGSFGTNGNWSQVAKTGEDRLNDVLTMKAALEADRMYGPYWLYLPANYSVVIDRNFAATYSGSIRTRLLEVDGLMGITVADQLPNDNILLVQMTPDVVTWGIGEQIQTVQWDMSGGFEIAFKAFAIQVPIIRADTAGRSGVFHMS